MISFETRYDEGSAKWQYRAPGGEWSKPLSLAKLGQALQAEITVPEPTEPKFWSKPLAHQPKRQDGQPASVLYEIAGGKVQRIASSAAERNAQQVAELAALMGLD